MSAFSSSGTPRGLGALAMLLMLVFGLLLFCLGLSQDPTQVEPRVVVEGVKYAALPGTLGGSSGISLPDIGKWLEWFRRMIELIKMGGVALALIGSAIFVATWVLSHLRQPRAQHSVPLWGYVALWSAYVPVGLTILAALGTMVPLLAPWTYKAFALAILAAAITWCIAVTLLLRGGSRDDLMRARKALVLAGTPWYCLALWLSQHLG